MGAAPVIVVTDVDLFRLQRCLRARQREVHPAARALLEAELARARVVPSVRVPPDVVTMNSRVVFVDEDTGLRREVSVVYPEHADPQHGLVSILSPIGSALLGLSVGQSIAWPLPSGRSARLKVVDVTWQPERAGRYDL